MLLPGGKALDKKQRKQWQAQLLERLGARPDKAPRCSAKIGQGMAKKRAEREARALEEAIAAGTVRVKGQGRKKQVEKGRSNGPYNCHMLVLFMIDQPLLLCDPYIHT